MPATTKAFVALAAACLVAMIVELVYVPSSVLLVFATGVLMGVSAGVAWVTKSK